MNLFFITGHVGLDASVDLFVRAKDTQDAIVQWHEYFKDWFDEETSAFVVEEVDLTTENFEVFEEQVIARVFDLSAADLDSLVGVLDWRAIPICALVKLPN